MVMADRRASKNLVRCGHCGEDVSRRTYYQHKRIYYDTSTPKWSGTPVFHPFSQEGNFRMGDRAYCSRSSSPVLPSLGKLSVSAQLWLFTVCA